MNLAEAATIPVSADAPKSEPQAPAKVKLALLPLKEATAVVERHCKKSGRFDGLGTMKCLRLVKELVRAGAQSCAAMVAALGGGDIRWGPSQNWQRGGRLRPEGVILLLATVKQEVAAIEDYCGNEATGEFDDRSTAQCRDLVSRLGTAIADAGCVILQGLGMRGNFDVRARAE